MGMAMYVSDEYKAPAWMKGYDNLAHCKKCDAVFNKNTEFVRGYNIQNGTMPFEFVKVADCKKGCCPVCNTPIGSE